MAPEVGTSAPTFALSNQHGETMSPVGHEACLLVFFPFAFSGICSSELAGLRDHREDVAAAGVRLIGVSCDPMFALRVFADRDELGFDLLSDFWPHGEVAGRYGCLDEGVGAATRSSYLLDGDGVVRWAVHHGMGEPRPIELHVAAISHLT